MWKAHRTLQEKLQGIKKGQVPDRTEWCIQRVEDTLGFAAGRFFVEEAFPGDSKKKGTKVITDIIDTFKESLKHLKWMDKESAKAASEKVSHCMYLSRGFGRSSHAGGQHTRQSWLPAVS